MKRDQLGLGFPIKGKAGIPERPTDRGLRHPTSLLVEAECDGVPEVDPLHWAETAQGGEASLGTPEV